MATQQPLLFNTRDAASASVTEYYGINQNNPRPWTSTLTDVEIPIPVGGTLKELNIKIDTAPGASNNWAFAVMVNGSPSGTLAGTIADSATTLTVTADQSITAGDRVVLRCIPTSTPTTFGRMDGNIIWEPTTDDQYVYGGTSTNALNGGATEYNAIINNGAALGWASGEANSRMVVAAAGTISHLQAYTQATPNPGQYIFTIRQNLGSTSVTVTLDNADFDKIDSSNSFSVTAGDTIDIECVGSGSAAATTGHWGFVFTPTTTGEIILLSGSSDNMPTTVTEYINYGTKQSWNATVANRDQELVNIDITLKAQYIQLNGNVTTGNYDFDITKDGTAQAGLNVNISSGNNGNATGQSIDITDGEKIALEVVPTGPPNGRDAYWGLVFTYAGGGAPSPTFIPRMMTY